MSLKEYLLKISFVIFLMLIIFPVILNFNMAIISLFANPSWDFLKNVIIWPIFGTLMWIAELLEFRKTLIILMFLVPFILSTYYIEKLRNYYFILFYFILTSSIIFGQSVYYFLLNQNNTIHSEQLIAYIIAIFISSFILYYLLKKYLWKKLNI